MRLPARPRNAGLAARLWPLGVIAWLPACAAPAVPPEAPATPARRCALVTPPHPLSVESLSTNSPHIALAAGQLGVVWEELEATHAGAHLAVLDGDGIVRARVELGEHEHARTRDVHVGGRPDGGFVAAWHESPKGGAPTSFLRTVSPTGQLEAPPLELGSDPGDIAGVAWVDGKAVVARTSTDVAGSQIVFAVYDRTTAPPGTRPGVAATPAAVGRLSTRAVAFTTVDSTTDGGRRLAMAWAEAAPVSAPAPARASAPSLDPASAPANAPSGDEAAGDLTVGTVEIVGPGGPLSPWHVSLGEETSVALAPERIGVAYSTPGGDVAVAFGAPTGFEPARTIGRGRGPDAAFLGDDLLVCTTDLGLASHVACALVAPDSSVTGTLTIQSQAEDVAEIDVAAIGRRAVVIWQQTGGPGTEVLAAGVQCAASSAQASPARSPFPIH